MWCSMMVEGEIERKRKMGRVSLSLRFLVVRDFIVEFGKMKKKLETGSPAPFCLGGDS